MYTLTINLLIPIDALPKLKELVYLFIHVIFYQFFNWWLRLRGLQMAGLFSSFCKLFLL